MTTKQTGPDFKGEPKKWLAARLATTSTHGCLENHLMDFNLTLLFSYPLHHDHLDYDDDEAQSIFVPFLDAIVLYRCSCS